jgi:hypothetical protein
MRKLAQCLLFLLAASLHVQAQECCPRIAVFGGYSYLNVSPKTDRIPISNNFNDRIGQHGYGVSVSGNLSRRFGIVADISRHMADVNIMNLNTDTSTTLYLFGPQIRSGSEDVTAFAHALVGGSTRRTESQSLEISSTDFAMAFGGGFDLTVSKHFAFRVLQLDYIPTRGGDNTPGIGKRWGQDFRVQVGIVVELGY